MFVLDECFQVVSEQKFLKSPDFTSGFVRKPYRSMLKYLHFHVFI